MTNADKIRGMTDGELADLLIRYEEGACHFCQYHKGPGVCIPPINEGCKTGLLEWLKQEHGK